MAESTPDSSNPRKDDDIKAPNLFERAKEEIEAILHTEKSPKDHHNHKETHGLRNDIDDENTPVNGIQAPNMFERAKEEIEAIVQTIHPKKEQQNQREAIRSDSEADSLSQGKDTKAPNLIDRAKEEIDAILHKKSTHHHHHKETHGWSDDIDENTPASEVKGPNVFERTKEEIEAIVQTIHPKKDSSSSSSSDGPSLKKEGGFWLPIGRRLEMFCSPFNHKKD